MLIRKFVLFSIKVSTFYQIFTILRTDEFKPVNALEFVCQNAFGFISQSFRAFVILLVTFDISGTLTVPSLKVRMII